VLTVSLELPRVLADAAGGERRLAVPAPAGTVRSAFESLAASHPLLHRRLRDESGALRRYVNVYVDGADVRRDRGLDTPVTAGATVTVLPSVAGG
jgi:molybdopterin converting factor small subunit